MIKANAVTKVVDTSEGSLQILRPISFEVKSGESIAIIGASGSGKSTLLGLLAGLDQVTEGEIFLDGEALHSMTEEDRAILRGNKVGFIFQSCCRELLRHIETRASAMASLPEPPCCSAGYPAIHQYVL